MNVATKTTTVGVIGAGRMGTPIIGHLVKKGFSTQASDVNPARESLVKELGARWATDNAALAAASDAILVCVGFDAEVRALLAEGGPLRSAKPGSIVAILSTVRPETVQDSPPPCPPCTSSTAPSAAAARRPTTAPCSASSAAPTTWWRG